MIIISWKNILVKNNSFIKIKNNQLIIEDKTNKDNIIKYQFDLENLSSLTIDNNYSVLTIPSILKITSNNVPIIITDEKHDPKCTILPLHGAFDILSNTIKQIELKSRDKGKLWKQIIQQKIQNEINILKFYESKNEIIEKLELLHKKVNINDESKIEAQTSRIIFKELFGTDFIRGTGNPLENAYVFGIKIICSKISTILISKGFHPAFGLNHKSKTNYFNLTYDFVEVLRPLVIYLVSRNIEILDYNLSLELRKKLIDILNYPVLINSKIMKIKHALSIMINSFVQFLNGNRDSLSLIELIPEFIFEKDSEDLDLNHEQNEYEI